jgi:hypothetical protein
MTQYKARPKSRADIIFFHSFAVKKWRSKHQETSSDIRQPGVDRALCSLTGNSSSRRIAALGTPSARRSTPSSADSTLRRSTDRSFALGPTSIIYQDWQRNGILVNTVPWRRLNIIFVVGTVTLISQHTTVPPPSVYLMSPRQNPILHLSCLPYVP